MFTAALEDARVVQLERSADLGYTLVDGT